MKKSNWLVGWLALALVVGGSIAFAEESPESVCSAFSGEKNLNCLAAYRQVPNSSALTYTLRFLLLNSNGLKDPSCVRSRGAGTKQGIKNTCQFVLNDLTSVYDGNPLRAHAYFIDLCTSDSGRVVKHFYVNKGTGTARAQYADREGEHSSNPGAYLTGTKVVAFEPYKASGAYEQIKDSMGGFIPAVRLTGLHSTNNDTSGSKPMHASPYRSSWGCPSVSPDAVGIMRQLAANGPSLVMNYGPSQFHPTSSLTKCNAVPDVIGGKSKARHKDVDDYLPRNAVRLRNGRIRMTFGPTKGGIMRSVRSDSDTGVR